MAPLDDIPASLQAWRALLTAHLRLTGRIGRELETACGISLPWYDVLFQLSVAPEGRLRMSELAEAVLLSPSGLTRLVDRIEAGGLVARSAVAGDRRSVHIQLTPQGRRLVERARRVVRESVARHVGAVLPDRELLSVRDALLRLADPSHDNARGRRLPVADASRADAKGRRPPAAGPARAAGMGRRPPA